MLDTRATERDMKGSWKEKNEQRNFFLLKKYGREIGEEFDNALIKCVLFALCRMKIRSSCLRQKLS